MKNTFTKRQWRVFLLCFGSYIAAYICRLNLAAALPSILSDLHITDTQGGMFQTIFAVVYAAGQLINGAIVDRVSAKRHISIGLIASALCNLAVGICKDYRLMLVLWGLNGAAQSMLWTPIVKILAIWYLGERRTIASKRLSASLILGNLFAWAISGSLASAVSWHFSFIIPAAIVLPLGIFVRFALLDAPLPDEDIGTPTQPVQSTAASRAMSVKTMFFSTGLIMVIFCCIFNGFIRDGITSWAPTIIAEYANAHSLNSALTALFIPMLNTLGLVAAYRCFHLVHDNARVSSGCLMALSAILALSLFPAGKNALLLPIALGLCCSATYGINPMLTSMIPLEYDRAGRVGLVAGIVDCAIYLGSSLAGVVTGMISDKIGWNAVYYLWAAVGALGFVFAFLSLSGRKNLMR